MRSGSKPESSMGGTATDEAETGEETEGTDTTDIRLTRVAG